MVLGSISPVTTCNATQASYGRVQLGLISEVAGLAHTVGADLWLSGGWSMDFFLGAATREHDDIDMFTLDTQIVALDEALCAHGYRPTGEAPLEQQRDYLKDGSDLTIVPVRLDEDGAPRVAGGRFVGEPWPTEMLSGAGWGEIAGIRMLYIAPAAQIEIKEMTPVWIPGRPRREKDAHDIAAIRQALHLKRAY